MHITSVIHKGLRRTGRVAGYFCRTGQRAVVLGVLLIAASAVSTLATTNAPPVFTTLQLSKTSVYEGETLTLTGAFTDPNAGDRHTVLVYWWGGDSDDKEKIVLPAGQSTFQVSHRYPDIVAVPSIKVVVFDHTLPADTSDNTTGMAWDAEFLTFQGVQDAKPQFDVNSIKVKKEKVTTIRNEFHARVSVEGDIAPAAQLEPVQVTAAWNGAGSPQKPCTTQPNNRHFVCETIYSAPGGPKGYPVVLRVQDDEGNFATHNFLLPIP